MRLYRIPYRWTWRTAWGNLRRAISDVIDGIHNTIRWAPVIWFDADFDWEYLASVMEYKLRRMHRRFSTARITSSWERDARRCLVCAELIRRLREDEYWTVASKVFGSNPIAVKHARSVQRHDLALLGSILGKHMNGWWD